MGTKARHGGFSSKELRKQFDHMMLDAAAEAEIEHYTNSVKALFGPSIVNNKHFKNQVLTLAGDIEDPNIHFVTDPIECDPKIRYGGIPERLDQFRKPDHKTWKGNVVFSGYSRGPGGVLHKRRTAKWKRRMAKRYLENAPADNRYRGWWT